MIYSAPHISIHENIFYTSIYIISFPSHMYYNYGLSIYQAFDSIVIEQVNVTLLWCHQNAANSQEIHVMHTFEIHTFLLLACLVFW